MTNEEYLRFLLDDRIPEGGTDADTFFTNADIADILFRNTSSMYMAAADGWSMRAAQYAALIDVAESGSARELSQLYAHADSRAKYFAKLAQDLADSGGDITTDIANGLRVIGKPVTLREGNPFAPVPVTHWHHTRRV